MVVLVRVIEADRGWFRDGLLVSGLIWSVAVEPHPRIIRPGCWTDSDNSRGERIEEEGKKERKKEKKEKRDERRERKGKVLGVFEFSKLEFVPFSDFWIEILFLHIFYRDYDF